MNPEESIPLVTIIAFGCNHYDHLKPLSNVQEDLLRFKEVLCNSEYSVFTEKQYQQIFNDTSSDLRNAIQDYLFHRAAEQDILILFFSGHGTAIGRDDFGFCMTDAQVHPDDGVILPTSVVKLSEIIGTLNIKNVSLILFIDSCYSGQISKQLIVSFPEIAGEMSKNLIAYSGSFFGLVTSCTDIEQIGDIGVISKALKDICEQGSEDNSPYLPMGYLSETITERVDSHAKGDSRSRVFIPPGKISNLPLCKNIQYSEPPEPINTYSFTYPYLKLLLTLWNDGKPIALSPNEILERTGSQSAYANHNKLSFTSWDFMRDSRNGKRELTQKGIEFLMGRRSIPKFIIENKITRECQPAKGSPSIKVVEKINLFDETEKIFQECDPIY